LPAEIYLDNHATTRLDPRVLDAMLPWMIEGYANPGSVTHEPGRRVAAKVDECRSRIAEMVNTQPDHVIFTSGATESINLALLGVAMHPKQKRRRMVSAATEHRAGLDPLRRLEKLGWDIQYLPVITETPGHIGEVELHSLHEWIDGSTALVSLMLGNNEIGTLQTFEAISRQCQSQEALLHIDATQAVGKIPVDIDLLGADLISFSAHKFYGPKGVGALVLRNESVARRIYPQIVGGGQQHNLRSGTLNSVGIIGMATALEIAVQDMDSEIERVMSLRQHLWERLSKSISGLRLNGPDWRLANLRINRLPGNLNLCFPKVEGQSLMLRVPDLAISSGSACTSADPHPSHVLKAIGRTEDEARSSIRIGIGRFNSLEEISQAADWLIEAYQELSTYVA
jgi:cysteine desulfurase